MNSLDPGHYRKLWKIHVTPEKSTTLDVVNQEEPHPKPKTDFTEEAQEVLSGKRQAHLTELEGSEYTEPPLSEEQRAVAYLVLEKRQNVFFTGAAGTGKSVLLKHIIKELKNRYDSNSFAITATTGIAAVHIGGSTLHSFAGIGLGKQPAEELIKNIKIRKNSKAKWEDVEVLLIDEVSMLSASLFTKLNEIAKVIRHSSAPFGGIQLVVCGDMFQLPPVSGWQHSNTGSHKIHEKFVFQCDAWRECIDKNVNLTQVFRQQDNTFADMLNELRLGRVSEFHEDKFQSLCRPPKLPVGIVPTKLYSTKNEVDRANKSALDRLPGTIYEYHHHDWFHEDAHPSIKDSDKLSKTMGVEKIIPLKVGSQVMLTKNLDTTLVNGSTGTVIGFLTVGNVIRELPLPEGETGTPVKREESEVPVKQETAPRNRVKREESDPEYKPRTKIIGSSSPPEPKFLPADNETSNGSITAQPPIEASPSLSAMEEEPTDIEECSGECDGINGCNCGEYFANLRKEQQAAGQLSYTESDYQPSEDDMKDDHYNIEKRIAERLNSYKNDEVPVRRCRLIAEQLTDAEAEKYTVLPLVKFYTPDGQMRYYFVEPETWSVENDKGNVIARRTQLPLILAWALTVHKSQGQTIPFLQVNLNLTFERGQAYVALSRATNMDTLQVLGFRRDKVRVDRDVIEFYKNLESVTAKELKEARNFYLEDELNQREMKVSMDERQIQYQRKQLEMWEDQLKARESAVDLREERLSDVLGVDPSRGKNESQLEHHQPQPNFPQDTPLLSSQPHEALFVSNKSVFAKEGSSAMFSQDY